MYKILLADDEPDIVEIIKYNLEKENYEVLVAYDGEEALQKVSQLPNMIILDIMMPKMDGFRVCEEIRNSSTYSNIPIIFLTAKSSESDEIKGLQLGANDFIQKPVSPQKLLARVRSNINSAGLNTNANDERNIISLGKIVIDKSKYVVVIDSNEMNFPRKEFETLSFLADHPNKVFNRDEILREIWGDNVFVVDRTVDVHIRKIRQKLGSYSNMIETVKGVGYRLTFGS
jgi:two-component system, OmpR family, alkaline phosphatase synthesis response regulator PhoP